MEECGDICAGVCGAGCGDVREGFWAFEGDGFWGCAFEEEEAGPCADGVAERFCEVAQTGLAFTGGCGGRVLLHACGAVEQDKDGVWGSPGEAEPAACERACDDEQDACYGEDTAREDEKLAKAREAAVHALGAQQEHHGCPRDGLAPHLVDEVDDHRQRGEREEGKECGFEECHRLPFGVRRMRKRTRSSS